MIIQITDHNLYLLIKIFYHYVNVKSRMVQAFKMNVSVALMG